MYGLSNVENPNDLDFLSKVAVEKIFDTHKLWNIACFNYDVFTHKLESAQQLHMACDLNFIVESEGLLKVTGSHIHCRSDNI